ncbi:MAG: L-fucose/L-arabinose isomerase family protein [Anaerolineae bacterium]
MERRQRPHARVGVFGIGLAAYWPQFDGLRERLEGYQAQVEERIASFGCDVVSAGLVDTVQGARIGGDFFASQNVDLIFCYVGTYAVSAQVLPIVQRGHAPVVVLNLQPTAALDYESVDTGEWLANCSACCVPEIACAFARADIAFNVVSGMLYDDDRAWSEIREWCEAASVRRGLRDARIGFLGHTYPGMLDMYSDFTMLHAQLGAHIELLEMDDLWQRVQSVTDAELAAKQAEARVLFEFAEPSTDPIARPMDETDLDWAARVAVSLDKLVADFDLDGITYYYRGVDGNDFEQLGAGMIMGNSMLTARGIPAAGEGDLKTCVAMLIMDRFEAGGSYTEFYAMDFRDNFVLMGHDGPGHIAISDSKPVLRALNLYHGKRGSGVSVEFKVRTGPITILGVTQTKDGRLKMLAAEGEALPGPTMRIGNTNSRLRFALDPAMFINRWCADGPTHHVALGVGHQVSRLAKLANLIGLDLALVPGP